MLLLQSVSGAQASPLAQHLLQNENANSVDGQLLEPQTKLGEIELINPLEGKGLDHIVLDNGIEGTEILYQWRDSDIGANETFELVKTLMATQSPTFVRDAQTKQEVLSLADRTQGIFDVRTAEQATQFLEKNRVEKLWEEGLIPSAVGEGLGFHVEHDPVFEQSINLWFDSAMVSVESNEANIFVEDQTPEDFQGAIENLRESVADTGLKSLRVPVSMWASTDTLNTLARELTQANLEMQSLTGWDGQVLGLKGNVNMTAGVGFGVAMASYEEEHGLAVFGSMDVMDHEILIHGVDALLAVESGFEAPRDMRFSVGHAALVGQEHVLNENAKAWLDLERGVNADMDGWKTELARHLESGPTDGLTQEYFDYITSPEETLAFTFEAIVYSKLGPEAALTHYSDAERLSAPSVDQAMPSLTRFKQAFETLNENWWDKMPTVGVNQEAEMMAGKSLEEGMEVSLPRLGDWRQARKADEVTPQVLQTPRMGR